MWLYLFLNWLNWLSTQIKSETNFLWVTMQTKELFRKHVWTDNIRDVKRGSAGLKEESDRPPVLCDVCRPSSRQLLKADGLSVSGLLSRFKNQSMGSATATYFKIFVIFSVATSQKSAAGNEGVRPSSFWLTDRHFWSLLWEKCSPDFVAEMVIFQCLVWHQRESNTRSDMKNCLYERRDTKSKHLSIKLNIKLVHISIWA